MWAMHALSCELDNPFCQNGNDFDSEFVQLQINSRLARLLESYSQPVVSLSENAQLDAAQLLLWTHMSTHRREQVRPLGHGKCSYTYSFTSTTQQDSSESGSGKGQLRTMKSFGESVKSAVDNRLRGGTSVRRSMFSRPSVRVYDESDAVRRGTVSTSRAGASERQGGSPRYGGSTRESLDTVSETLPSGQQRRHSSEVPCRKVDVRRLSDARRFSICSSAVSEIAPATYDLAVPAPCEAHTCVPEDSPRCMVY